MITPYSELTYLHKKLVDSQCQRVGITSVACGEHLPQNLNLHFDPASCDWETRRIVKITRSTYFGCLSSTTFDGLTKTHHQFSEGLSA